MVQNYAEVKKLKKWMKTHFLRRMFNLISFNQKIWICVHHCWRCPINQFKGHQVILHMIKTKITSLKLNRVKYQMLNMVQNQLSIDKHQLYLVEAHSQRPLELMMVLWAWKLLERYRERVILTIEYREKTV